RVQRRPVPGGDSRRRIAARTSEPVSGFDHASDTRGDDCALRQWIRTNHSSGGQRVGDAIGNTVAASGDQDWRHYSGGHVRWSCAAGRVSIQRDCAIVYRRWRPTSHGCLQRTEHSIWNSNHRTEMKIISRALPAITLAALAVAQCPVQDALPPAAIKNYPMASDRYSVQYSIGGGPFTDAKVYISYYGGSLASPPRNDSGYVPL